MPWLRVDCHTVNGWKVLNLRKWHLIIQQEKLAKVQMVMIKVCTCATSRAQGRYSHASMSFMSFNTIVISVRHSFCLFNITPCVLITIRSWSDTFDFPELRLETTQYTAISQRFYIIILLVIYFTFFFFIKTLWLILSSSHYKYNTCVR